MGRRTLKIVLALILAVLVPSRAYASTLVGSYDIPQDADAVACDFLGYDYDTMDSGLRALLHSSTVGGGTGTDSNPNFAGYAAFRDSLYSPALMGDYQWYSRYDGFMFVDAVDKARSDVAGAVRWWDAYGGDDGGSGGSGGSGTLIIYGTNYHRIDADTIDSSTTFDDGTTLSYPVSSGNSYNPASSPKIIFGAKFSQSYTSVGLSDTYYEFDTIIIDATGNRFAVYAVSNEQNSIIRHNDDNGNTYTETLISNGTSNELLAGWSYYKLLYSTNTQYSLYFVTNATNSGGSGSDPEGGPVPEPTPTQPQVPSGPTFSPTVNINTGSGGTVDLSPITERLDVMNQNFIDFADSFHTYWEWWGEMMADLDEQLQGYSSTIATWLQMIYERLSSLSSPNPSTQPTGWLDWLAALLAALVGDLPSAISGIQQSMSGLRNLFPFSIPWDLGVLLGLFVSSPVTPVFDLPFAYSATNTAYIHIDCSQWDGVMNAVRSVELVAFAAALALRTRELINGIEVE